MVKEEVRGALTWPVCLPLVCLPASLLLPACLPATACLPPCYCLPASLLQPVCLPAIACLPPCCCLLAFLLSAFLPAVGEGGGLGRVICPPPPAKHDPGVDQG